MQFARAGHIHPHCFFPILEQHGGLGVFENYVVAGVAAVELLLDFGFQIVVGVLGFPVAAGHAQGVFHGAVGEYAGAGFDLRNQPQLFPMVAAISVEAAFESVPDAGFIIRTAIGDHFLQVLAVSVNVWVVRHSFFVPGVTRLTWMHRIYRIGPHHQNILCIMCIHVY